MGMGLSMHQSLSAPYSVRVRVGDNHPTRLAVRLVVLKATETFSDLVTFASKSVPKPTGIFERPPIRLHSN